MLGILFFGAMPAHADGVKPTRITCDSGSGTFEIEYKNPQEVFALYPGDNRDLDKDTLVDDVEKYLAGVFAPVFLFDGIEDGGDISWHVVTECGEPFTIWQVTPLTSPGMAADGDFSISEILITYQFLFNSDGGYPGYCNGGANGDDHPGDNDYIKLVVGYHDNVFSLLRFGSLKKTNQKDDVRVYSVTGQQWYGIDASEDGDSDTEDWTFYADDWGAWEPLPWADALSLVETEELGSKYGVTADGSIVVNPALPGWLACHPSVFLSAGKHHKYLDRRGGCFSSPNSKYYDGGDVDACPDDRDDGDYSLGPQISSFIIPDESQQAFQGANVGEQHSLPPEGEPYESPEEPGVAVMLGDRYLADHFYSLSPTMTASGTCELWFNAGDWQDEHAWSGDSFLGSADTSSLSGRWKKASPRNVRTQWCHVTDPSTLEEDDVLCVDGKCELWDSLFGYAKCTEEPVPMDFDGDGIDERGIQTYETWLATWAVQIYDKCPFGVYGSAAEEMLDGDVDGWGDLCDNCSKRFNPYQDDADRDGVGDVCDSCPHVMNASDEDRDGDGFIDWRDQLDLDGDGEMAWCETVADPGSPSFGRVDETTCPAGDYPYGGDLCDTDPDGDGELLSWSESDDYPTPGTGRVVDMPEAGPIPVGDCAPFLWTLEVDADDDGVCDLYNFIEPGQGDWLPRDLSSEELGQKWIRPSEGYLRPRGTSQLRVDRYNGNYSAASYRSAWEKGNLPEYGSGPMAPVGKVIVAGHEVDSHLESCRCPSQEDSAAPECTECPGEFGYDWEDADAQEVFWGNTACLKNVVELWRYYRRYDFASYRTDTADGVPLFEFNGSYGHSLPAEFRAEGTTEPSALGKQLLHSLDPATCKVDNCARFTKTGSATIAPLSNFIMANDGLLNEGTEKTKFCSTPNWAEASDSAELTCRYDAPSTLESEGYDQWFRNGYVFPDESDWYLYPGEKGWEFQADFNHDGIGDMCSDMVDIDNLIQEHNWLASTSDQWLSKADWQSYAASGAFTSSSPIFPATDALTGFKVMLNNLGSGFLSMGDLGTLCDGCASGTHCEVQKLTLLASQRLGFDMVGMTTAPVRTTIGACSCNSYGDDETVCMSNLLQKCGFPEDRGWDAADEEALDTYEEAARDSEYFGVALRPRFPGFRYAANRTAPAVEADPVAPVVEYWSGKKAASVCRNVGSFFDTFFDSLGGYEYNPMWELLPHITFGTYSWDEEKGRHSADGVPRTGCQEISMTYGVGEHRSLAWRHLGQQEPNDDDPYAGTVEWDHKWHLGHKTKMRLAVKPYPRSTAGDCTYDSECPSADYRCWDGVCVDVMNDTANEDDEGRDVWLRQWHSDVPEDATWSDGAWPEELGDQDRPFTEAQLGSREGVVLLRKECRVNPPGLADEILVNEFWVNDGCPGFSPCAEPTDTRYLSGTSVVGSAVGAIETAISRQDGRSETRPWTGRLASQGARFPVAGFGMASVHTAAPNGGTRVLDIVVGGTAANGAPSGAVWIRDRAAAAHAFVRYATSGPAFVEPRLFASFADGRLYVLGDAASGRVWELTGLYSGRPRWVGMWSNHANGLTVDAQAAVVDAWKSRAYLLFSSGQGIEISAFAVAGGEPVVDAIRVSGTRPPARSGMAAAFQKEKGRVLVYGGVDAQGRRLHDLWSFDTAKRTWTQLARSTGELPAREGAEMIAGSGGKLYLAGGTDAFGPVSGSVVWALDATAGAPTWRVQSVGAPRQLLVGARSLRETYHSGEPVVFQLGLLAPPERTGTPVQVRFSDAGGKLMLVAIATGSSTRPIMTRESTGGTVSFTMRRGEEWTLIVGPRLAEPAPSDDRSFSLTASIARTRAAMASLSSPALTRFDAAGSTALVSDWNRLSVLVRNGEDMTSAANVPTTAAADVVVDGAYAYVADFEEGLRVLDVSAPEAPLSVGGELALGNPDSIAKMGDRVYLGAGLLGVQVIDVGDPAAPRWVDTLSTDAAVADVSASAGLLTVSLMNGRVDLYEVDGDGSLSRVGGYRSIGWIDDTQIVGDELHVMSSTGVVEIVDIAERAHPVLKELDAEGGVRVTRRFGADFAVQRAPSGGIEIVPVESEAEGE